MDLWCFNVSLISPLAGPVFGNYRRRKSLTLKWLPFLPHPRLKSLKLQQQLKVSSFPHVLQTVCCFIDKPLKKKEKLTLTAMLLRKVLCKQRHGIGPCLFSMMRPSGGMIHICFVSTVNWFQLRIKWEISVPLPKRKSERNVQKPKAKASEC